MFLALRVREEEREQQAKQTHGLCCSNSMGPVILSALLVLSRVATQQSQAGIRVLLAAGESVV